MTIGDGQSPEMSTKARRASAPSLLMRRKLQLKLDCSAASGVGDRSPKNESSSLDLPDTFATEYDLGEVLGSGSVATVRRAVRRCDGGKLAVKLVMSQDEEMRQFTRDEYSLAASLKHPSIVKMEKIHSTPCCLMICMELCMHGSLEGYLAKNGIMSEPLAVHLFQQLLFGVNYLHLKRIVHRDVKPANLLLQSSLGEDQSRPNLKISDFNSAKQIGGGPGTSVMLSERGTHAFSAPELRFGHIWNERVDIWASGMCFYFMLHAKSPFNIFRVRDLLETGRLPELDWIEDVSDLARNAIQQCLTIEMRDRPAAMELMLHPLFYRTDHHLASKDANEREDIRSRFVVAHSLICGILYVGIDQESSISYPNTSAEGIHALEGPGASLFGYHASSQMSSSCWKELRNHSDSLQRLAELRYERSFAGNRRHDEGSNVKLEVGKSLENHTEARSRKLDSTCSTSTCSPDSPVSLEEVPQERAQPRVNRKARTPKAHKDHRRWFSTHSAVNASLDPEMDEHDLVEAREGLRFAHAMSM